MEMILQAFGRVGLRPGTEAAIALDVADSTLLSRDGRYHLRADGGQATSSDEMIAADAAGWTRTRSLASKTERPRTTGTVGVS